MQKTIEEIKKAFESKILVKILYVVGIVLIAMLIFSAGIVVGFRKASFGNSWGEHYKDNFGMRAFPRPDFRGGMMNNFPNANGAIGEIIKIELPTIIVRDKDNIEKVILIKDDTRIEKVRDEIKTTDLKISDFVVIIGTPNAQGQIEAKFIRIMPAPEFLK